MIYEQPHFFLAFGVYFIVPGPNYGTLTILSFKSSLLLNGPDHGQSVSFSFNCNVSVEAVQLSFVAPRCAWVEAND